MDIYIVVMSNDEMDETEIAYCSTKEKAQTVIDLVKKTDGFEYNCYRWYKAPVDYIEINDAPMQIK